MIQWNLNSRWKRFLIFPRRHQQEVLKRDGNGGNLEPNMRWRRKKFEIMDCNYRTVEKCIWNVGRCGKFYKFYEFKNSRKSKEILGNLRKITGIHNIWWRNLPASHQFKANQYPLFVPHQLPRNFFGPNIIIIKKLLGRILLILTQFNLENSTESFLFNFIYRCLLYKNENEMRDGLETFFPILFFPKSFFKLFPANWISFWN